MVQQLHPGYWIQVNIVVILMMQQLHPGYWIQANIVVILMVHFFLDMLRPF